MEVADEVAFRHTVLRLAKQIQHNSIIFQTAAAVVGILNITFLSLTFWLSVRHFLRHTKRKTSASASSPETSAETSGFGFKAALSKMQQHFQDQQYYAQIDKELLTSSSESDSESSADEEKHMLSTKRNEINWRNVLVNDKQRSRVKRGSSLKHTSPV